MIKNSIACMLFFLTAMLLAVQDPDDFFQLKVGSDRVLLDYRQIVAYFNYLAENSQKLKVINLGKTTLGNDFFMSIVSDPENLSNLDQIREWNRRLAEGRIPPEEAEKLLAQTRPVIFITCNLHSSEIASSQMILKFVHQLIAEGDEFSRKVLKSLILCIVPSVNPDGQLMTVDWYRKYLGTPYEGSPLPFLYHHYAGHDNNRDWFKLSLKETNLLVEQLYRRWYPQLILDIHQMGEDGDRFFIPPFQDPITPQVHPLVWRMINFIGANIALKMEEQKLRGVASRGYFTGWWIGALDDCGWFHNIPGILFEAASARLATPVYIEREEVSSPESIANEEATFTPSPWTGGWWRLGDIINYEIVATRGLLEAALLRRDDLLRNVYRIARDNIERGEKEPPYGFIIPYYQRDSITARRLIDILLRNGIEVKQLQHPVRIGNKIFDKRSYYIPLAQAYRSFIKNLFEKQHYPDLRRNKSDRPILPYDVAAWTLPLGMGVETCVVNEKPLKAVWTDLTFEDLWKLNLPQEKKAYLLLDSRENWSYFAAFALLKRGIKVLRCQNDGEDYAAGSFFVPSDDAEKYLNELQKIHPFNFSYRESLPANCTELKNVRIGLYQNYGHNMAEGWLRYVFDQFQIDYRTLRPADFKNPKKIFDLDLLIFVNASESEIENGLPDKKDEIWAPVWPDEYRRGIGKNGQELLEKFLKSGKVLLFMQGAVDYAISKFKLPVENIAPQNSDSILCPGSYLQAEVKPSELTLGMPLRIAVFYRQDAVFQTYLPSSAEELRFTPLVFPQRELLLSGWLQSEDKLVRKALVVDFWKGKGRIILIGPDLIHRTHSEGTYKLIFNALLSAGKRSS